MLQQGNLSWRFYSRKCEYIRPITEYIETDQLPNFEDFLSDGLNQDFKPSIDAHDNAVLAVEAAAGTFFDGLMHSSLFLSEVQKSLDEYKVRVADKPQYPDAAPIEKDLPKYVAEYLINSAASLPSHYVMHRFWEEFRNKFDLAGSEFGPYQQRESFQRIKQSIERLKDIANGLLSAVEKHRFWLCSTYDIPAAPIQVNKSFGADAYLIRNK